MSKTITIGNHTIGAGHPCFVIAEAGVNHNGDAELAKQLIHAAKKTGAQCVKFQTFRAENLVTNNAPKAAYQLKTTNPEESQKAMLQSLELSYDVYKDVIVLCDELDIVFFSTAYSFEDVDFLDELDVPAFKFASMHCFEPALLRYAAKKGRPIVLSTGMATLEDVRVAVEAIRETGNEDFVLLQCTTNYPSAAEDANLLAMVTIKDTFDCLVGYSDHTQTDCTPLASVALGACILEKHFTLDTSMPGPDQSTSYNPQQFTELVQGVREVQSALGSSTKEPCEAEAANASGMRRSIVSKVFIPEGTNITEDMLHFKRPFSGLSPVLYDKVVGSIAARNIDADSILQKEDISFS